MILGRVLGGVGFAGLLAVGGCGRVGRPGDAFLLGRCACQRQWQQSAVLRGTADVDLDRLLLCGSVPPNTDLLPALLAIPPPSLRASPGGTLKSILPANPSETEGYVQVAASDDHRAITKFAEAVDAATRR